MRNPIAVFDTGIGSYSIVKRIREKFPRQDIVYLADRASFPYGAKTSTELLSCVSTAIRFLEKNFQPNTIVVASNAPSVMVLEEIRRAIKTPLIGVYPPIVAAENISKTGYIGVLGVNALVRSAAIREYIEAKSPHPERILSFNASPLVELVESGVFLTDQQRTTASVQSFVTEILQHEQRIDTFTLSSTHLPWLTEFFQTTFPALNFVDPADEVVNILRSTEGMGTIECLVTESGQYPAGQFLDMAKRLGLELDIQILSKL